MPAPDPSRSPPARRARGTASGTCGELAQGVLPDGTGFVVTCPIDRGTAIEVMVEPANRLEIVGVPAESVYLDRALRRAAELVELGPSRITVEHRSGLYVGKGMASSTADIVAAARALSTAVGLPLRPEELAELAAAIEPTDGIMFDGITASDPRTGARVRTWDWWPQYVVVMAIPPESFATAGARFVGQEQLAGEYADLLTQLDVAIEARDAAAFAAQATRSAEFNEAFLASSTFAFLGPRAARLGALGTCVAHTGTVAGLLFDAGPEGHGAAFAASRELERVAPRGVQISTARTRPWPASRPLAGSGAHHRRSGD